MALPGRPYGVCLTITGTGPSHPYYPGPCACTDPCWETPPTAAT